MARATFSEHVPNSSHGVYSEGVGGIGLDFNPLSSNQMAPGRQHFQDLTATDVLRTEAMFCKKKWTNRTNSKHISAQYKHNILDTR